MPVHIAGIGEIRRAKSPWLELLEATAEDNSVNASVQLRDAGGARGGQNARSQSCRRYERAALPFERAEGVAEIISRETGKAVKDARAKVLRSQDAILPPATPAGDAIRIQGERVPRNGTPAAAGRLAYGGINSSGIGREGPRYTTRDMSDMSEERLVLAQSMAP